jgi:Mor family transcriptional regulator
MNSRIIRWMIHAYIYYDYEKCFSYLMIYKLFNDFDGMMYMQLRVRYSLSNRTCQSL